jgi:two-component system cell cycle sensor histidine kinase/response regulator CckA
MMNTMSVSVPPGMEPLFLQAEKATRDYFKNRSEKPEEGSIEISGERYILVRAASMSVEFYDLVASLYHDGQPGEVERITSNFLFDMAHASGKADARHFHQLTGATDPIEKLSLGPTHFAHKGWAFVAIDPDSRPLPNENYFLTYEHPYSFEADAWQRRGRRAEHPVCAMNAGYSSGWCEESFGIPLVATEIACRAAGGESCRFIMAPPWRMEEHLARLGVVTRSAGGKVDVAEFFQRKRLEEKLARKERHLEMLTKRITEHEEEIRQLRSQMGAMRSP